MFGKQCLKLGSTTLLLIAALIVGGCVTTTLYRATPEDTRDLSPAQAREMLIRAAPDFCAHPRSVTYKALKCGPNAYLFSERPTFVAFLKGDSGGNAYINTDEDPGYYFFYWRGASAHSNARDFVRAWYVLAHARTVVDPAQEAAFERVAQSYRNASVKPQLPEEAVRYKVQAELAVQQKRFDDAVDLYDKALDIAPWWPVGHYNRGLILGELKDYEEGIWALQKYLKLEPNASNARAVQLNIYQWESLVPRAAK